MNRLFGYSRKVMILLLAVVLLLNGSIYAETTNEEQIVMQQTYTAVINEELQEAMSNVQEDETLPIWIWMEPINCSEIEALVLEETGMDPAIYENEEQFDRVILPEIEENVCAENEIEMDSSGKFRSTEQYQALLRAALLEEYDQYWAAKRNITKREYSVLTSNFIASYVPEERTIFYQSQYSATIAIEATFEEITMYAQLQGVNEISLYIDYAVEPELDFAGSQIGVYCEGGTGYAAEDGSWFGCTGLGVKVGIIEASHGEFDSSAPQLVNNSRLHVLNTYDSSGTISGTVSTHATMVTSIIAGKHVSYNGRVFKGIVPKATVYQVPSSSMQSVINAVSILVNQGVSVINYSAGANTGLEYSDFDKEIDNIIATTGVVFVKSAGNRGIEDRYVTSPGKAINAITVGNALTKTNGTTEATAPFSMSFTSSYSEADYLPNKPDIAAPGSNISALLSADSIYTGSGTSFAAPMVTGIIAEMFEYRASLIGHPTRIKACLMLAADSSKIATINDAEVGNQLREKSGAGFVTAMKAVRYGLGEAAYFTNNSAFNGISSASVYCEAGQTIRAIMVYDKKNNISITGENTFDDYNLLLLSDDYNVSASSISNHNNVEIIEYTVENSGYYELNVSNNRIVDAGCIPTVTVVYTVV